MVQYDGVLLCNKPFGVSSHDIIARLRQTVGQKRIGHTGTLDPRATGLLVVCLGRATKIAQFLADVNKVYDAEIRLGIRSDTFDSEGVDDEAAPQGVPDLSEKEVRDILSEFRGVIKQKVPAYSAVKIGGQRLYQMARRGQEVDPPEREIIINDIMLTKLELPQIAFTVNCSKGTYIRSLANEIGERIGCGAYLSRLNRMAVGNFELKEALSLNEIKYNRQAGTLKRYIIPIEEVLSFPVIKVSERFSPYIISGRSLRSQDVVEIAGEFGPEDLVSLMDHDGKIMAVGKAGVTSMEARNFGGDSFYTYVRVLN